MSITNCTVCNNPLYQPQGVIPQQLYGLEPRATAGPSIYCIAPSTTVQQVFCAWQGNAHDTEHPNERRFCTATCAFAWLCARAQEGFTVNAGPT